MNRGGWLVVFGTAMSASACAAVIGLDSGNPTDGGGAGEDASATDNADGGAGARSTTGSDAEVSPTPVDAGTDSAISCASGTANCNGNPDDGCEQNLNDPRHCGSCTTVCGPMTMCQAYACCTADNGPCSADSDCCGGSCKGPKCHK